MATLEKIRRRSVLLLIVIAVALLAFIVGDALTNSQNIFGNRSTVAEAAGQKIDITDYQAKRTELGNQIEAQRRNNPNAQEVDQQLLAQAALDQLVTETLVENAIKKLGVKVTGDQLRHYMLEQPINQNVGILMQQMQQAGLNVSTPQQAYQAIFNPQTVGKTEADMAPYKSMWLNLEKETEKMIAQYTYSRLLQGTFAANKLDKKNLRDGYRTKVMTSYAFVPYGNLDAKKYPVSNAELKAAYDKDKNRYRVAEETKTIAFINVDIAPSQKDVAASKALAENVVSSLKVSGGQLSKDAKKAGVATDRNHLRASDIRNARIKDFVASAPIDSVMLIQNDARGFEIIKMIGRTAEVDSIQLNLVQVVGKTLPARVMALLNQGTDLDAIQKQFSADSLAVQKEQWIPLFTAEGPTNALSQAYTDSLAKSNGNYVVLEQGDQGALIAKVVKRNAPVSIYEYDDITYKLKPSTTTVNAAQEKLAKFLAANNTAAKFMKNAAKAGYNVATYDVSQSTPAVPVYEGMNRYLPDSRQVIRWVMIDGDKGDVSHYYESKDALTPRLYAAAIVDEFDDFYPVTHRRVKEELTRKVRADKAGEAMVKKYSGKGNLQQTAAAMGVPVQGAEERFARISTGPISDPRVLGRIAGSKKSSKPQLIKGDNGVYAVTIDNVEVEKMLENDAMFEQQFMQFLNPDLLRMFIGKDKVKNYIYKFEAGD